VELIGADGKTVSVDSQHAFSTAQNTFRQTGYFLQYSRSSTIRDHFGSV